jgi:hypothetical protein
MDMSSPYETIVHIPTGLPVEDYSDVNVKNVKVFTDKLVWFPRFIFQILTAYRNVETNATLNSAEKHV